MIYRLAIVLPIYLTLYATCYWAAFLLRLDFQWPGQTWAIFYSSLPWAMAVKCGVGFVAGDWRRKHRYTTLADIIYLGAGATTTAAILWIFNFEVFAESRIPRSVILIDWALVILGASMLRSVIRLYVHAFPAAPDRRVKQRAVIYGANPEGIGILRAMKAASSRYQVVGFVDDSLKSRHSLVAGLPVYSAEDGLGAVARRARAGHLLIPSTTPGKRTREFVVECQANEMQTHVIPSVHEIVDGRYKLTIRDVTIADLLRREPAELDMASIRQYISGQRVLVTGGAGSIGSELCRQVLALAPESLALVDHSESGVFAMQQEIRELEQSGVAVNYHVASMTDLAAMRRIMTAERPQLLFHAAAYKHVPLLEEHPHEAIANNVFGAKNVFDLADEHGVERVVLISTDKAVRPSSVMGASKLMSEKYLQAVAAHSKTRFITVRFGNVLDSAGSVVPTFRRQIQNGGPVTVTHPEMVRYFMTIPEAVQLVLQAGAIGASGDVLVLDMGQPVRIVDLAKDMIYLSGMRCGEDIDIVYTGVRPGEKLYEELFYPAEEGAKQVHDKIFLTARERIDPERVQRDLERLHAAAGAAKKEAARVLHEIVSAYVAADETARSKRAA